MSYMVKCYHCGTEIPDAGSILNYKKYARPTLETSGKRTFCCEECYQEYLKDRQAGECNGQPIYKKVWDGKEYFVPYIEAWYGFENIEDCKKRMSMTNVAVVDPEMFAQHNRMMFGDSTMKVYVIEVISISSPFKSKISQEGYSTLEAAQNWCRNKPGAIEINNGWAFESDDYEYMIHEVLVR